MKTYKELANSEHSWQKSENIAHMLFNHTVLYDYAEKATNGYIILLTKILKFALNKNNNCIDIGAGGGYIAKIFNQHGFNMKALEHTEDGVNLLKKLNPELRVIKGNIVDFLEPNTYDLIFSREVYTFTRINAFTEQCNTISNIIDNLKPSGVFLLVASDVGRPHCMQHDNIIKIFRKDKRIKTVTRKYHELLFKSKINILIRGKFSAYLLEIIFYPVFRFLEYFNKWAMIHIIAFVKKINA